MTKYTFPFLALIITFCFILFLPGFFTYFHQDDFIHMAVSQRFDQVVNAFNIFQKGEFPFYRPIPTQVYFYFGKLLFGYNPLGYHVVNFLIFAANIILVYQVIRQISGIRRIGYVGAMFYGINATHAASLYSPAYVHELLYVFFGVSAVYSYFKYLNEKNIRHYIFALFCFVFALMTKETAVVLPGIILLIGLHRVRPAAGPTLFRHLIPYIIIESIYLFAHVVFYGIAQSPSYQFIIGKQTVNALVWYFLWALSVPNILIDFFGPGIKINPVFFQVTGIHGWVFIVVFPLLLLILALLMIFFFNRLRLLLLGILWFIVGLIPLLIFPLHHLATEQAFSLGGLSLAIGVLLTSSKSQRTLLYLWVGLYLIVSFNSILLARKTHWIVRSANQAKNTIEYIKSNYPNLTEEQHLYFLDGEIKIPQYGSSKQLYQALGDGKGLNIILEKSNLRSFYQFMDPELETKIRSNDVVINSSRLLGY